MLRDVDVDFDAGLGLLSGIEGPRLATLFTSALEDAFSFSKTRAALSTSIESHNGCLLPSSFLVNNLESFYT